MKKNVLVIGATGGVGRASAIALKQAGFKVIGTSRSLEQTEKLISGHVCDIAIQLDLARTDSIESAFRELEHLGIKSLAGAINCAANSHVGALETTPQEEVAKLFQVNVFGSLLAARLSIPLLRKASGRLIMVGSVGGSLAFPLLGIYSATKFAIEAICDTLRRELEPWNIHVSMVNPGAIKTSMAENQIKELEEIIATPQQGIAAEYLPFYKRHKKMMELGYKNSASPERIAEDIVTAMTADHPKPRYYPGLEPAVVSRLSKYLPDSLKDAMLRQIYPEK